MGRHVQRYVLLKLRGLKDGLWVGSPPPQRISEKGEGKPLSSSFIVILWIAFNLKHIPPHLGLLLSASGRFDPASHPQVSEGWRGGQSTVCKTGKAPMGLYVASLLFKAHTGPFLPNLRLLFLWGLLRKVINLKGGEGGCDDILGDRGCGEIYPPCLKVCLLLRIRGKWWVVGVDIKPGVFLKLQLQL